MAISLETFQNNLEFLAGLTAILREDSEANRKFLVDLVAEINAAPDMKASDIATRLQDRLDDKGVVYKRSDVFKAINDIDDINKEFATVIPLFTPPKPVTPVPVARPTGMPPRPAVGGSLPPKPVPGGVTNVRKPGTLPGPKPAGLPPGKAFTAPKPKIGVPGPKKAAGGKKAGAKHDITTIQGALDRMLGDRSFKKEYLIAFIVNNQLSEDEEKTLKKMKVDDLKEHIRSHASDDSFLDVVNAAYEEVVGAKAEAKAAAKPKGKAAAAGPKVKETKEAKEAYMAELVEGGQAFDDEGNEYTVDSVVRNGAAITVTTPDGSQQEYTYRGNEMWNVKKGKGEGFHLSFTNPALADENQETEIPEDDELVDDLEGQDIPEDE